MRQLNRWLVIFGFKRGNGEGLPLINPAIPRPLLWKYIAMFALVGIIMSILHHTVAPWI
jgi:hypothetical protein